MPLFDGKKIIIRGQKRPEQVKQILVTRRFGKSPLPISLFFCIFVIFSIKQMLMSNIDVPSKYNMQLLVDSIYYTKQP